MERGRGRETRTGGRDIQGGTETEEEGGREAERQGERKRKKGRGETERTKEKLGTG